MSNYVFWNENDIEILKKGIEDKLSYKEIGKLLNKTESSCQKKAIKLNLAGGDNRRHPLWSLEQESELVKYCSSGKLSYEEIGKILNKSEIACKRKATILGIKNDYRKDGRKVWKDYEVEILKELAETGLYSYEHIGQKLKVSGTCCQDKARLEGISNPYIHKKYSVNEDFWIPNLNSCYWAGFAAADGCVKKIGANAYLFDLQLSDKDENHLKQFSKDCGFNGPITYSVRENKHRHARVAISSMKWAQDLEKYYNITPRKTHTLQPPNLENDQLILAYLIGFTDGDGTIYFNEKRQRVLLRWLGGSYDFIRWIKITINKYFGNYYIRNRGKKMMFSKENNSITDLGGIRACVFIDYLRRFDVPKLDRKWNQPQILEYIEQQKQKYPNLFIVE